MNGQKGVLVLSPNDTLMFFHERDELVIGKIRRQLLVKYLWDDTQSTSQVTHVIFPYHARVHFIPRLARHCPKTGQSKGKRQWVFWSKQHRVIGEGIFNPECPHLLFCFGFKYVRRLMLSKTACVAFTWAEWSCSDYAFIWCNATKCEWSRHSKGIATSCMTRLG